MTVPQLSKKYRKLVLLIAVAVTLTALAVGYHHSTTAQSQAPQLSLNTPVSFPGDI